jgi:hypothetical protein
VVSFRRALLAGAIGAVAWELVARLAFVGGLRGFDVVRVLGTLLVERPGWAWWPIGLALHAGVSAIWAVFYAYFFFGHRSVRGALEGALFSIGPAILACALMIPELDNMHPAVEAGRLEPFGPFAWNVGPGGPLTVFVGHLVWGLTVGSVYLRPVGYRVKRWGWRWRTAA